MSEVCLQNVKKVEKINDNCHTNQTMVDQLLLVFISESKLDFNN